MPGVEMLTLEQESRFRDEGAGFAISISVVSVVQPIGRKIQLKDKNLRNMELSSQLVWFHHCFLSLY